MAVSPDGKRLVTSPYRSGVLRFWDAVKGTKIHEHKVGQLSVLASAFSRYDLIPLNDHETGELESALLAPIAADSETW